MLSPLPLFLPLAQPFLLPLVGSASRSFGAINLVPRITYLTPLSQINEVEGGGESFFRLVHWDKGAGSLAVPSVEGPLLRLFKVSRLDMGAYMCIASNDVPPAVSKRIQLGIDCERKTFGAV